MEGREGKGTKGRERTEEKRKEGKTHQTTSKDFPNILKRSDDIPKLRARIPRLRELALQSIEHMIEREPAPSSLRAPRRAQGGAEAA